MSTRIYGPRGISDETVRTRTGKGWAEWTAILDAWDARTHGHTKTARYLVQEHGVNPWWAQSITGRYEWDHGLRPEQQGREA